MSFEHLDKNVILPGFCSGCGLCAGICPVSAISMNDCGIPELTGTCVDCNFCDKACPGHDVDLPALSEEIFSSSYDPESVEGFVEQQFVGFSRDSEIRSDGASGGMVTAMLCFLLRQGMIDGAVIAVMDPDRPWTTIGTLATTEEEIRKGAQSKYCVTPSLAVLSQLRRRKGRFAVAALPCQVIGLRKLASVDPSLAGKISYILGLYCNCNVRRNGHLEILAINGIRTEQVKHFHFRTGKWPGKMGVELHDGRMLYLHKVTLTTVLNVMFRLYSPLRCTLCCDALSEYADLSFGDFWAFDYRGELSGYEHSNLISQRTSAGREILSAAHEHGAVELRRLSTRESSKRIINMAAGKKMRCFARLSRRAGKNIATVDYHVDLPPVTCKSYKSRLLYDFFRLFSGRKSRWLILKVLVSPWMLILERINMKRKEIFKSVRSGG